MFEGLIPLLSLGTLLCVCIFALINAERTKDRMRDPTAPVSTLARDGKFGGVAFLMPPEARFQRVVPYVPVTTHFELDMANNKAGPVGHDLA